MLIVSTIMRMIGSVVMIQSNGLVMVCLSIAFFALSYNFSSGSGDALAFDTLKGGGAEKRFDQYESNQFSLYRLCSGISTLCAGFALFVGHRIAYGTDLISGGIQLLVLSSLYEVMAVEQTDGWRSVRQRLTDCTKESLAFLTQARSVLDLMLCNALVGAVDVLLLFFLQAKLPERGIPA